ncbi:MAG: SCP2 sterol-binding domain-containing protein [Ruminococcus flavefaciens]|nr:SCP2 sterol-binding domain-containing protein [Ruminococcus flavefaciens]MCM1228544.1 SCP2 sterol-binding domain-containing protein [Ruminococcus flavefaciens]
MKLSELLEMLRTQAKSIDASGCDFLAVQFNMKDVEKSDIDNPDQQRNPGVFYIEVKNGKTSIEPYEYNDRSCAITMKMSDFIKMMNGKLDAVAAFTIGKLKVDGDIGKAIEFSKLIKK